MVTAPVVACVVTAALVVTPSVVADVDSIELVVCSNSMDLEVVVISTIIAVVVAGRGLLTGIA